MLTRFGIAHFVEDGGDGVKVLGGLMEVGEGGLFDDCSGINDESVVFLRGVGADIAHVGGVGHNVPARK